MKSIIRNGGWNGGRIVAAAVLFAVTFWSSAEAQDSVTIGVVRDGPAPDSEADLARLVADEIEKHLPAGTRVAFKSDASFDAGWSPDAVPAALQSALSDPGVDIVLVTGLFGTLEAGRDDLELVKPVVSAYLQLADAFRLPYAEGEDRSTKENLSFILAPHRIETDLRTFQEMMGLRSLRIAVSPRELELLPELAARIDEYETALGIDISFLAAADVDDLVATIDASVEAVYLTRMPQLSQDDRRQLLDALSRRQIPTFSLAGPSDVELGALATSMPDVREQLVRRVALNLAAVARGTPVLELPVLLSLDPRLVVNGRTAAAVGYAPDLSTRIYAHFVHEDALDTRQAESLSFAGALEQAQTSNTFLSIQDELVESVRQDQYRTRSALLPKVLADFSFQTSNVRADLQSIFPAKAAFFGLTVRQMIFDDGAISGYRSSLRLFEGSEHKRESERIETLARAGTAFLGLGLTQALYRVQVDNLDLTETNLELARLRRDVGYSGLDEIYFWEAEVATSRAALFEGVEDVESARITLNQVLGLEQNRRWLPEEIEVDSEVFTFLDGRLDDVFDDPAALERFREVLVTLSLTNAPELLALGRQTEAVDIQVGRLNRRFYVPSATLDFSYTRQIGGSGLNLPSIGPNFYQLFLFADYPVFEGAGRIADIRKAEADRRAFLRQIDFIEELVERDTRTAWRGCESSFPRIRFAREAAEAATKALDIVRDKYAEGIVDVTDLIASQNQKLTADQLATAAVYEFLLDLVELQRAISWFEDDHTAEAQERFFQEITAALASGETGSEK